MRQRLRRRTEARRRLVGPAQSLLAVLLVAVAVMRASAMAPRRPPNAENLTVISLRPYNQSGNLRDKNSADLAGDLFFYVTDRFVMPFGCRHSQNHEWYCGANTRALIDAPDQVYTQAVLEVDGSYGGCPSGDCSCDPPPGNYPLINPCPEIGSFSESCACSKYADCNPDSSGNFHCGCGDPHCWGTPPNQHCYTPPSCNVTGKVTIASRYCTYQAESNSCARCADGCKGVWSRWKSRTAQLLNGLWFSTTDEGDCDSPGGSCAWRQLATLKTIAADCANAKVHEYLESVGTCFGPKPSHGNYNRTTDAYIKCTFATMLGIDPDDPHARQITKAAPRAALVGAFRAAFDKSPGDGGCPDLPPPVAGSQMSEVR